ncbi:alpha/beta hydrolase [Corynebacterium crudilactis]|uniref:alpha/beta hydrolase n=1 Tax=Corynebacterium crudilactis TaxID=1652495 RepID=UPI000AF9037D|nr:alpha/beta hydrolase [Corynebacterium crudilactis]
MTTTLVYLHGVGRGDLKQEWKDQLSAALTRIGFPNLDDVTVISPVYAGELSENFDVQHSIPLPPVLKRTVLEGTQLLDFERRTAAMETRLGRHNRGEGGAFTKAVVSKSVDFPLFAQARNFLNNQQIRAQVHSRILEQLPEEGEIVLLGHSLGSVIAADLLRRLPAGLSVKGFVTIGSPLANGEFNVDDLFKMLRTPPSNLAWWVNFWSGSDPVAAKRGVSVAIPWVLDFRIKTPLVPGTAHSSRAYCSDDAVAEAIGFGLFGSRSKEIVLAEKNLQIPLDDSEIFVLQALRYCFLVLQRLKGDEATRYAYALRETQDRLVEEIKLRNAQNGRVIPLEIARLDFDNGDAEAAAPIPDLSPFMPKEKALERLIEIVGQNLLLPFEIEVSEKVRREALRDFTAETQLGSTVGADVFDALHTATGVVAGATKNSWRRWGAFGIGAAAVTAATGGLALAAAPGVAGAALITSALAGFGPGGMVGGLVTAGTLLTVGGGSLTVGALSSVNTTEEIEAFVVQKLSLAILWQRHEIDRTEEIWTALAEAERHIVRELMRVKEVSDGSSPILKGLEQQRTTIGKALKYLSEQGMEPVLIEEDDEESAIEKSESTSVVAPLKKLLSKNSE